ncbi:BamA/TamA family outer membrane protein [Rhodocytophaga aerolata]|uniref:BamA/TamA family outer membrane protein n=1 Tax=Rhodocytophaga aerolata TaxID=455078 RepID=A0ABT8R945_9BACT|nr:BamA/TamA family outer membrane protein [Rhodocytophaga aerolata]MDO1448504.1 BamA/TamA family outer membrane protein [Rhodocytophaga aerolata]
MLAILLALLLNLRTTQPAVATVATIADKDTLAAEYVIVNHIIIEGNVKTKEAMILRELDITAGDTLHAASADLALLRNKNKIVNTNLFVTVDLHMLKVDKNVAYLLVKVTERWYIFPMLIFELADRNFNEWWVERGRSLKRVNYGFKIAHKNFRGRGEQLRATAQFGFTKRFELGYSIPYLDKAQKTGIGFDISYSQNKSVAYETQAHKLDYLDSESVLRSRFSAGIRLTRRNKYYCFHTLEAKYHDSHIADTLAILNPDYFLKGRTRQQYVRLAYTLTLDRRDIAAYPLHGHYFTTTIAQSGITPKEDLHLTTLLADIALYRPISPKYFWTASLRGKVSSPEQQPFHNIRGFGYGQDFVRGYEYYVVDGQNYGLAKLTFKRELFNVQADISEYMPFRQFQTIPMALYLKVYGDAGYVQNKTYNVEDNFLANKLLYGYGVGFDFVTFYNTVFRVDFSMNRQKQAGFFFHFVRDI